MEGVGGGTLPAPPPAFSMSLYSHTVSTGGGVRRTFSCGMKLVISCLHRVNVDRVSEQLAGVCKGAEGNINTETLHSHRVNAEELARSCLEFMGVVGNPGSTLGPLTGRAQTRDAVRGDMQNHKQWDTCLLVSPRA